MTDVTLRSVLPRTSPRWYTRRTQWRLLGVAEEDLDKPKIAVVNSSSKLAPCFSHLDEIADRAVQSVRDAGGVAFEIRTTAPTDFIMSAGKEGGHVLAGRDLVANDIESVVDGAILDGMICLASCDKTTPGQLMAAARTDVPTLIVSCGFQTCGRMPDGSPVDIEEVFLKAGHLARGGVTPEQLCEMSDRAIGSPGVCAGMGTANTMHLAAEALGMAIPGYAPVGANSPRMWDAVAESGRVIVDAVLAGRTPRKLLTAQAFRNAIRVVLGVSGSINAVKHLDAIARECGLDLNVVDEFRAAAREVLPIAAVRPNGQSSIEEFVAAGGTLAVLDGLGDAIDRSAALVTGSTWDAVLSEWVRPDDRVTISSTEAPKADACTIQILRGSLAPHSAIVKLSVTERRPMTFRGPARVFSSAQSAIAAVDGGTVREGDALVLRGYGPVGTPGMGMASNLAFAIDGAGLAGKVALITDGQFSGLVNTGVVLGEVLPEGIGTAPLALVEEGDIIDIDIREGRADLMVDPAELQRRAGGALPPPELSERGWLHQFASGYEDRYVATAQSPKEGVAR